jgi:hypothetical protein
VEDDDLPELTRNGELVNYRGAELASFWPAKIEQALEEGCCWWNWSSASGTGWRIWPAVLIAAAVS